MALVGLKTHEVRLSEWPSSAVALDVTSSGAEVLVCYQLQETNALCDILRMV